MSEIQPAPGFSGPRQYHVGYQPRASTSFRTGLPRVPRRDLAYSGSTLYESVVDQLGNNELVNVNTETVVRLIRINSNGFPLTGG
jgi:hypothetical protein